jgi:hypothetical protein
MSRLELFNALFGSEENDLLAIEDGDSIDSDSPKESSDQAKESPVLSNDEEVIELTQENDVDIKSTPSLSSRRSSLKLSLPSITRYVCSLSFHQATEVPSYSGIFYSDPFIQPFSSDPSLKVTITRQESVLYTSTLSYKPSSVSGKGEFSDNSFIFEISSNDDLSQITAILVLEDQRFFTENDQMGSKRISLAEILQNKPLKEGDMTITIDNFQKGPHFVVDKTQIKGLLNLKAIDRSSVKPNSNAPLLGINPKFEPKVTQQDQSSFISHQAKLNIPKAQNSTAEDNHVKLKYDDCDESPWYAKNWNKAVMLHNKQRISDE